MALQTFQQFGMVEIIDGVITIPNWNKHQSLDAYEKKKERDRLYQAERRANQRALVAKSSDSNTTQSSDVAVSEGEKEREEDTDIDRDIEEGSNNSPVPYESIKNLYNDICKSFPRCNAMSDSRKKAIKNARNISMYIVRSMTQMSLPQIGTTFGRDHSTVHSNISMVENQIMADSAFEASINEIIKEIKRS